MALRSLISRSSPSSVTSLSLLFSVRTFASKSVSLPSLAGPAPFLRLRPLVSALQARWSPNKLAEEGFRCFSTRPTTSSLNDPSPNWSNRPPKETILLDGCDFEHWLVVMEPPVEGTTRDEIIDSYIKTLAQIVGSEEEARKKIYSVSTKHYFAFGALVSEELSYKIKALPGVRWVLPDSYLDVKNKDYGGEPFIDGKAVPYDPKYHEEWVRNNARANERSRRNDRPRNYDRSRNFERRRENMQNRDFQNRPPPIPNQEFQGQNPVPSPSPNMQRTMPPMPPSGGMPNRDVPPSSMPYPSYQGENMQNRDFQNRPPPIPNQEFQGQNPVPSPSPNMQRSTPPMPPSGGMPNRDVPPSSMPNPSYQGASYQNRGPGYQSNFAPPVHNQGYQNPGGQNPLPPPPPNMQGTVPQMPHPAIGGIPNRDVPPYFSSQGTPFQSQGPSYQSNYVPNQNGGNIPGNNAYQGGAPYQGGGNAQQGVGNAYQGSGGAYQGSGGGHQVSGDHTGGGNAYQSGTGFQARDVPGRD